MAPASTVSAESNRYCKVESKGVLYLFLVANFVDELFEFFLLFFARIYLLEPTHILK